MTLLSPARLRKNSGINKGLRQMENKMPALSRMVVTQMKSQVKGSHETSVTPNPTALLTSHSGLTIDRPLP